MMPGAEVKPPMMATANALSPMMVPICGATLRSGAKSTPAIPARSAESAYEAMTARGIGPRKKGRAGRAREGGAVPGGGGGGEGGRGGEGPPQGDEARVGDHGPRHDGMALGEVHGAARRPRDVIAEGDQPVHAAEGQPRDEQLNVQLTSWSRERSCRPSTRP